jgi:O-antigen/teichoic acid export membrane protein
MIRRDLLTTLTGIGAGQLVLLVATPLLARAYGPHAFGVYSVIVAVSGVIATVAALRLDLAVTSARDEDVLPLARAALLLPLLVVPLAAAILSAVLVLPIARNWSFGATDMPAIALIAIPQGLCLAASGLATRRGRFRTTAVMRIAQPLVFATLALTIVRHLAWAMAAGWVAALVAALPALRDVVARGVSRTIWPTIRREWRFPMISAPVALLDVLALALPLLFIAATFGEANAGNYAQVQRLVGAPLSMASVAVSQVFFKYAGDRFRADQPLIRLIRGVVLAMGGLACAVLLAIAAIGHPVLQWLVGPGWRTDTGFLILALCPVLCRVIASPVSTTLIVTGRLATIGKWQASYFVATFCTLYLAQRWLSFDGMLALFACSEFIMYAAYLLLSVRAAMDAARYPSIGRPVAA